MKNFLYIIFAFCIFVAPSCKSSQSSASGEKKEQKFKSNSLTAELRRQPGVTVRGDDANGTVMVGGYSNSITQSANPLFVLDGQPIGNSLPRAATMIDVTNIKSIRIMKGSEAYSRYGRDAQNGAIIIRMKKEKDQKKTMSR